MSRITARRTIALGAVVVQLPGCFNYVPATLETVPAGQEVRIFVNRQGNTDLASLSNESTPIVRGKLISREQDRIFIRVPTTVRQEGFHSAVLGQDISVPLADIVQFEQRRVDPLGTGLLVAGTAGVAAAVIFVIMDAVSSPETPGCQANCEESRVPFFSFPVR